MKILSRFLFIPVRPRQLVSALTFAIATVCAASPGRAPDPAQLDYAHQRAACLDGSSGQGRDSCLKEAVAALAAARRGVLDTGESADALSRNALRRCQRVSADDREACERMVRGEGETSGSVRGGGVLRQIVSRSALPDAASAPGRP